MAHRGAVTFAIVGEDEFGLALLGIFAHELVFRVCNAGLIAGCAAVQCEGDGIQNGALAGACGAGNAEDATIREASFVEVNAEFSGEGIDVLDAHVFDFHNGCVGGGGFRCLSRRELYGSML